jgi:hypothetical protein
VLVIKTEEGIIISFARCTLPEAGDKVLHEDTVWPKGCVRELLDEYDMKTKGVERSENGKEKFYREFGFIFRFTNACIVCLLSVHGSLLIYIA